jgi:hypothetical protein
MDRSSSLLSASSVVPASLRTTPFSAEFDAKMPVTLQGVVTRIEMVNPHG